MRERGNLKKVAAAPVVSLILLIPLFSATLIWPTPLPSPPGCSSFRQIWLHVDGKYIKDSCQQKVLLRGTAFGDLTWRTEWQGDIASRFNQLMKLTNGKANVIRVAISPDPQYQDGSEPRTWAPGNIHPEVFDDDIDQLLSAVGQRKVYLIIEFHGGFNQSEATRIGQDPTDWINWILHFVNRYKFTPAVTGFEIYNEPYAPEFGGGNSILGEQRFMNMVTRCVKAINATNPKALIFVSSGFAPDYYSAVSQLYVDNPLKGNVVYTWDAYYKNWPIDVKALYQNKDWSAAYAASYARIDYLIGGALRANLPVFESEVGWNGQSAPPYPDPNSEPQWDRNMNDYLSIVNGMETNWSVWWWWDNPDNLGLANSGFATLSPQGQIWAQYL
jgi:hypothetical protein